METRSVPLAADTVFSSLHTHTVFCDGGDDVETVCRAAFEKGLCAVGFSAHGPVFKKTGIQTAWHIPDEALAPYMDEVRAARSRWEGKLAVYLGLELDYIKGLRSARDPDIRALDLDYIIGSVHYIVPPGAAPFTVDGPREELERGIAEGFGGDAEAMMNAYWDAVQEMIAIGGFDILGHVDLVKKHNREGRLFSMESASWLSRTAETARAAAAASVTVEVNTGGLNRGYTADTYPSLPFLRLFKLNNVPALITADAHTARDLDGHYGAAMRTMLQAGYTEHVLPAPAL